MMPEGHVATLSIPCLAQPRPRWPRPCAQMMFTGASLCTSRDDLPGPNRCRQIQRGEGKGKTLMKQPPMCSHVYQIVSSLEIQGWDGCNELSCKARFKLHRKLKAKLYLNFTVKSTDLFFARRNKVSQNRKNETIID